MRVDATIAELCRRGARVAFRLAHHRRMEADCERPTGTPDEKQDAEIRADRHEQAMAAALLTVMCGECPHNNIKEGRRERA
jgi:hypothetical protein